MAIRKSAPLRAQRRASVLSVGASKLKRKRTARAKPRGRARWRVWLTRALIALVGGPFLIIALYGALPPPITPLMVIRALEGESITYRWTPLERISPHLARAAIAAEDNRFCVHWGFDLGEIGETLRGWRDGERPRGASTISMQTAKNILLWPHRHVVRKVIEAWLTPQVELLWSKRRILEVYLNVAELGPGIYGAEAAARHYFAKPASALTAREAALLAAALPSPRHSRPDRPSTYLNQRVRVIHTRIRQLGPLLDCAP